MSLHKIGHSFLWASTVLLNRNQILYITYIVLIYLYVCFPIRLGCKSLEDRRVSRSHLYPQHFLQIVTK